MIYAVGIFLFVVGFLQVMTIHEVNALRHHARAHSSNPVKSFLAYRRGVRGFLMTHPDFVGTVPLEAIAGGDEFRGYDPRNRILSNGATKEVVVWFEGVQYSFNAVTVPTPENRTVGLSSSNGWVTAGLGDMGELPVGIPTGCIVSDVIIGGKSG